jgi:hypothetical protein
MHQNEVFFIFLKLFLTSAYQNNLKIWKTKFILSKKEKEKVSKFEGTWFAPHSQTHLYKRNMI